MSNQTQQQGFEVDNNRTCRTDAHHRQTVEQLAKRSMRDGGNPHVPSSPGEPPRIDTKNLHESIMTETQVERTSIETRIGTNVDYGLFLELGTSKMQPRPWLRPAFDKVVKS